MAHTGTLKGKAVTPLDINLTNDELQTWALALGIIILLIILVRLLLGWSPWR